MASAGDLTCLDLGLKFSGNDQKGSINRYAKNRGAARCLFSAFCEKPVGGGRLNAPPPGPPKVKNSLPQKQMKVSRGKQEAQITNMIAVFSIMSRFK